MRLSPNRERGTGLDVAGDGRGGVIVDAKPIRAL